MGIPDDTSSQQELLLLLAASVMIYMAQEINANMEEHRESRYSQPRTRRSFNYARAMQCIDEDFLGENAKFTDLQFRREFAISRGRYLKIKRDIQAKKKQNPAWVDGGENDLIEEFIWQFPEFHRRSDGSGRAQIHPDQKLLGALNQLCLGIAPEHTGKYFQIGETVARESKIKLCQAICELYREDWLRTPDTEEGVKSLMKLHEEMHELPGMIGSIDCVHWYWEGCPVAHQGKDYWLVCSYQYGHQVSPRIWSGTYKGKEGCPSVVLEAMCDYELRIHHAFFGMPGAANDRTINLYSPLTGMYLNSKMPEAEYKLGDKTFTLPFILADGIYPDCAMFVKTISEPRNEAEKNFAKRQEAARKDIERAFGVLKKVFKIIKRPSLAQSVEQMRVVMDACIILHNMNMADRIDRKEGVAQYRRQLRDTNTSVIHQGVGGGETVRRIVS